jgi:hypothetical protein
VSKTPAICFFYFKPAAKKKGFSQCKRKWNSKGKNCERPEKGMSWKWFSAGCALLTACLLGVAAYQDKEALDRTWTRGSEKLVFSKQANPGLEVQGREKIRLEDYAQKLNAKLEQPQWEPVQAESVFTVSGSIEKTENLAVPYLWVHIEYQGKPKQGLPKTLDEYIPVENGRFGKNLRLFQGKGDYRVYLRLPDREEKEYFYLMAAFTVRNASDTLARDVAYSIQAREAGLKLSSPQSGYVRSDQAVRIRGEVKKSVKKLLVQLKKGNQSWERVIRVTDGKFQERIPLLFGQGVHQLEVLVPDREKWGSFREGATLYVEHTKNIEREPVAYTDLYAQRGIRLETPVASGDTAGLSYRVAGRIDATAPYAKETTHLIVKTKKEGEEATYFLPVNNFRFDDRIWLRFGPGKYEVNLYVPEITTEKRDYFRFFKVARFEVNSSAKQDLRYLLPSRGIESDSAEIQNRSGQLVNGASTPREKAKAIYDYVAKNMTYDMEKYRKNEFHWSDSAIKSLRTKKGICQDYVFLTIALLRSAGLPARFVEGKAGGQRHAWVEVRVDGRWLVMDPTWGSGYITKEGTFQKRYDSRYFDPPSSLLDKTHRRTGIVY